MDGLQPGDPGMVGRYRLLGRLGEGGMGRVFLGMSPGGRQVAVKLIHAGPAAGSQFRERFAREIAAARQVGGFHTAPVVDADPDADPPWMVTAYIHGPSLQDAVSERGPFGLADLCALGAGLAEGLGAIHACGLVHRDLKPSNVILAEDGPRIIDFGIARSTTAGPMTTVGSVVGTYSYMSPEQVRGDPAGPASDVFALGCTLAFAATARSPFGEGTIFTVVSRIISEPPDLEGATDERGFRQLLTECLAKSPADRPALADILTRLTSAGLDDPVLPHDTGSGPAPGSEPESRHDQTAPSGQGFAPTQTIHTGDPVPRDGIAPPGHSGHSGDSGWDPKDTAGPGSDGQAGPGSQAEPGPGGRAGRRAPRRGVLIGAGVALIALLAAGLGVLLAGGGHAAKTHLAAGRTSPRPSARPSASPPTQPQATLHDPKGKKVFGVAFSSSSVLATGDNNGSTYLWNVDTGKLTGTLPDPNSQGVNSVAFSRNGNSYATADASGSVYLWDAATGKLTGTLNNARTLGAFTVAISPDGGFVAVGNETGSTTLWNVATGKFSASPTATLRDPHGKYVYAVAFSPDGGYLAAGDTDGSTYLWNVATGKLTATLPDPNSQYLYDVAFSPDGRLLAVSDSNGNGHIYLWNIATRKLTATLQALNGGDFADVAFSPDGRFVAAADGNGSVHVWNVATGQNLASLPDPTGNQLIGAAFSPDGRLIAVTDVSGDAYLWNMKWLNS
jgi:serine/threonine protein kinase